MENRMFDTPIKSDFQPPYCLKQGSKLTFNVVGSCKFDCPDG